MLVRINIIGQNMRLAYILALSGLPTNCKILLRLI